jgi:hypothetical protein
MEASAVSDLHMVWAYVDPVTVLPLTSLIATVVGVFVLCGKSMKQAVTRWVAVATMHWRGGPAGRSVHFGLQRRRRGEFKAVGRRHGAGQE